MGEGPPLTLGKKPPALLRPLPPDDDIVLGRAIAGDVVVRDVGQTRAQYDVGDAVLVRTPRGESHDPQLVQAALQQLIGTATLPVGTALARLQRTIRTRAVKEQLALSARGCFPLSHRDGAPDASAPSDGHLGDPSAVAAARVLGERVRAIESARRSGNPDDYEALAKCVRHPVTLAELQRFGEARVDMSAVRDVAFTLAQTAAEQAQLDEMQQWLTVTNYCEELGGLAPLYEQRQSVRRAGHTVAYTRAQAAVASAAESGDPHAVQYWLQQVAAHAQASGQSPLSDEAAAAVLHRAYFRGAERILQEADRACPTTPATAFEMKTELSRLQTLEAYISRGGLSVDSARVDRLRNRIVDGAIDRLYSLLAAARVAVEDGKCTQAQEHCRKASDILTTYGSLLPAARVQSIERQLRALCETPALE